LKTTSATQQPPQRNTTTNNIVLLTTTTKFEAPQIIFYADSLTEDIHHCQNILDARLGENL
jgi:TolB-like protein